jgi:hypothetical protein
MITGSPIVVEYSNHLKRVNLAMMFGAWARALRRIQWILDHFCAFPTRRVEIGFTGFSNVQFPGGWGRAFHTARRSDLKFERTLRDWSSEAQEAFFIDALGKVFNLFGASPLTQAEAKEFLASNDPERGRESPLVWDFSCQGLGVDGDTMSVSTV